MPRPVHWRQIGNKLYAAGMPASRPAARSVAVLRRAMNGAILFRTASTRAGGAERGEPAW